MSSGEAILGQPSKVFARLYTKEFMPLPALQVGGVLEWLDAPQGTAADQRQQRVVFEAVPNQPGEFLLTLPHDRAGKFILKVTDGQENKEGTAR